MVKTKKEIIAEISELSKTKEFKFPETKTFSKIIFKEINKNHQLKKKNRSYILTNFSAIIEEYRDLDWKILQKLMIDRYMKMFKHIVDKNAKEKGIKKEELSEFILNDKEIFLYKYQLDMSLSQSYRPRAGKGFEFIIEELFQKLNYKFLPQPKNIQGNPDFIFPSEDEYEKDTSKCMIIGAKTTIRNRWKEIITEGDNKVKKFCLTIGDDLSDAQAKAAMKGRLFFVCPKKLKESKFSKNKNILSFEEFLIKVVEPNPFFHK